VGLSQPHEALTPLELVNSVIESCTRPISDEAPEVPCQSRRPMGGENGRAERRTRFPIVSVMEKPGHSLVLAGLLFWFWLLLAGAVTPGAPGQTTNN